MKTPGEQESRKRREGGDPYVDAVLRALPPDVRGAMPAAHREALADALGKVRDGSRARHLLDVRFRVPLFWTHYYAVILFGKDERRHSRALALGRRAATTQFLKAAVVLSVLALVALGTLVAAFFLLYLLKSAVGIDLFPDKHLADFLGLRHI